MNHLHPKKCFPFPFHYVSSRPLVTKGEEGQLRFVQTEEGRSGAQRDFVASFLDSSSNNTFQHLKLRNCLELIFIWKPLWRLICLIKMPTWTREIFVKAWSVDPKLSCLVHTSHTGLGRDKPWHVQMSNRTFPAVKTLFFFFGCFLLRLALGRISVTMCDKSTVPAWSHDDDNLLKSIEKVCANYAQMNLVKQICCCRKYRQSPH